MNKQSSAAMNYSSAQKRPWWKNTDLWKLINKYSRSRQMIIRVHEHDFFHNKTKMRSTATE